MSHPFDAAISLAATGEHRFAGATHPAYANMVGPYGGATCAVLLNAALLHPQRLGEPIALTVNYAAPLADGSFEIEARPVRTNRSTQHWNMTLAQQGAVVATSSAVFAARRETWSAPEATPPAGMPPAITLPVSPVDSRPRWVRQYDMRFAEDESPALFSGTERPDSETRLWVRDEPPRPLDFPSLAAICDCFLPGIFVRRGRRALIGTVTLTTYFHAGAAMLAAQGDRHLLGSARSLVYRHGYHDQRAEVWSDAGELLASTHQMVYYRE